MSPEDYLTLKEKLLELGYDKEIDWSDSLKPCSSAFDLACEHSFVVANSGMKAQIAGKIFDKCWRALTEGREITDEIFRNKPKRKAMTEVYKNRDKYFGEYQAAEDKLVYLETLPYIGEIIKYHLAKNLGLDYCKPDRHLVRIAKTYNTTPEEMCKKLAEITGDRITTVDLVIWRAANLRMV